MKQYQVGIVCSSFDLLHAGHIKFLRDAKELCEVLIVALNAHPEKTSSEKHKPIQSLFERYTQVAAVKYVDDVMPYEDEQDLLLLLQMTPHDVRILGSDYQSKTSWTGKEYELSKCINTEFICRDHTLSTSELRKRIVEAEK